MSEDKQINKQSNDPLMKIRNLNVSFSDIKVVDNVSFNLYEKEILAIVGESGSGKSTIALSLLNLFPFINNVNIEGKIIYNAQDVLSLPSQELCKIRGKEVSMIFQEPMSALNPLHNVKRIISESPQLHNISVNEEDIIKILNSVGIENAERLLPLYPHELSGGLRQRVMIASSLICKPKIMIADEPTTSLDAILRNKILDLIKRKSIDNNMSVFLITHDINSIKNIANRICVMKEGKIIEIGNAQEILDNPQNEYTKLLLKKNYKRTSIPYLPNNDINLEVKDLNVTYGEKSWFKKDNTFKALQNINFNMRKGQTYAVIGESGSGKTTLSHAILRLIPFMGETVINGETWHNKKLKEIRPLRKNIQIIFQDPFSSLSPRMLIKDILNEPISLHYKDLSVERKMDMVSKAISDVELNPETDIYKYPHEFSGGQRQRIAIARSLILNPKILILDEPTSALDIITQEKILSLLEKIQKEKGISYLLITHDLAVVRRMAHDVLILREGKVVETGTVNSIFSQPKSEYGKSLIYN